MGANIVLLSRYCWVSLQDFARVLIKALESICFFPLVSLSQNFLLGFSSSHRILLLFISGSIFHPICFHPIETVDEAVAMVGVRNLLVALLPTSFILAARVLSLQVAQVENLISAFFVA